MISPAVTSPFARSLPVRWLFAAGLVAIPFDAIGGIAALGELGNELSFPFFAPAIAVAFVACLRSGDSPLLSSMTLRVAAVAIGIVILSFLVNASDIVTIVFRERTGLNKFATSLLVILYGFALAWLAEQLEPERYAPYLARCICWSAVIATGYLVIEFAGKQGLLGGAFDVIDAVVHTRQADVINAWNGRINEKVLYGWDPRLRSVSFEPPAFGNYTGFAWPWVLYAAVNAPEERKLGAWALLAVFTLAVVVGASRTGLLLLGSNLAALALLVTIYGPRGRTEAGAAARVILPVATGLGLIVAGVVLVSQYGTVVAGLIQGDSVSNISRFGLQLASFHMFMGHPILGVGLGQFGFHVIEYLPDWIFRSPEVAPMITFPTAPWPNVYSLYGRIAAELGLVGLLGWIGLWLVLAAMLARRARVATGRDGPLIAAQYPIILNCSGVLVSGITTDTFRTPMIWIALGLGCGLVMRARAARPSAVVLAPSREPAQRRSS